MCNNDVVEPLLKSYVPRHIRLGLCCQPPVYECYTEVVEVIPVVDDDGVVVESHKVLKSVPVFEVMSKYKVDDFRLSSMVRNGVPLKLVNINHSNSYTITELERISKDIDVTERYVQKVASERREKESWFKSFDDLDTKELEGSKVQS